MPYIITTTRNDRGPWGEDFANVLTRIAVATLDEARELVTDILSDDFQCPLSADGGTVGPLPDGTVIEVRPADTITCPGNQYHGPCGKPAHWRGSASLTSLHPHGAWECSDTRCWTMTTPDEFNARMTAHPHSIMPDTPITHVWSSFGHRFINDGGDGTESCLTCGAMYQLVRREDDPTCGDYMASNGDDPTPCTHRTDLYHGVPGEGEGATDHDCNCLMCA